MWRASGQPFCVKDQRDWRNVVSFRGENSSAKNFGARIGGCGRKGQGQRRQWSAHLCRVRRCMCGLPRVVNLICPRSFRWVGTSGTVSRTSKSRTSKSRTSAALMWAHQGPRCQNPEAGGGRYGWAFVKIDAHRRSTACAPRDEPDRCARHVCLASDRGGQFIHRPGQNCQFPRF